MFGSTGEKVLAPFFLSASIFHKTARISKFAQLCIFLHASPIGAWQILLPEDLPAINAPYVAPTEGWKE